MMNSDDRKIFVACVYSESIKIIFRFMIKYNIRFCDFCDKILALHNQISAEDLMDNIENIDLKAVIDVVSKYKSEIEQKYQKTDNDCYILDSLIVISQKMRGLLN